MSDGRGQIELMRPAGWDGMDTRGRLRWLVAVQEKLRRAHNAEADTLCAGTWTDGARAMFRRRQAEHWNPRLFRVGAEIAALAATLPKTPQPDAPEREWIRYDRDGVRRSLTGSELDAVDLDAILLGRAEAAEPPDPCEDLTTFTEVDADGDITLTAARCTVDSMRRDAASYVYKDFGAGHFGEFTGEGAHFVDARMTGASLSYWQTVAFWAVAVDVATMYTTDEAIVARFQFASGSNARICLSVFDSGSVPADDYAAISQNVTYYHVIDRSGTTCLLKIYTDSDRTSLHDTLSVTCSETAFRYLYCCMSLEAYGYHPEAWLSEWSENYDLHEAAGAKPRWYHQRNAMRRAN